MARGTKTVVYGIPNCDTVKKARVWLEEHGVEFEFHDFKKHGVTEPLVQDWLKDVKLDALLNRRGTTWRALSDDMKAAADTQPGAIALMIHKPSVIKRPVLVVNTVLVGLLMASFALTSAHQPLWLRLVQLAAFGAVNSMQFTAMNTLTLKDLGTGGASSGNSLF